MVGQKARNKTLRFYDKGVSILFLMDGGPEADILANYMIYSPLGDFVNPLLLLITSKIGRFKAPAGENRALWRP